MIYKHLEHKSAYKKVGPSCNNKTMRAKKTLIKDMKTLINYLINFQKKVVIFMVFLQCTNVKLSPKQLKGKVPNTFQVSNEKFKTRLYSGRSNMSN